MQKALRAAAALVFWLAVWQLAATAAGLEILLPTPAVTFKTLFLLAAKPSFWHSCGATLLRILLALICGTVIAVLLAALTAASKWADAVLSPALRIIKATPVASFIIIALVWIGRDFVPTLISALIVLPVIWSAVSQSAASIDVQLTEMGRIFGLSPIQKLRHLYIPAVKPSFDAAFLTSIGLAWKAGVAAEVLCTPKTSIGTSLYSSKVYLETPELFAWTAAVIILSMIFEKLFCIFSRRRSVQTDD